ncbi:MAG: adenylosuccinate synthetase, partial [Actinobacteria bacterium]|nr:adenylosuccinate synthetase [Actinomycetota bacterium]
VCVRYRGGEDAEFDHFPYHQSVLHGARAEYVELDGFDDDIGESRSEADLPEEARAYLRFVAEQVGVPVALVGVGPGREQVIWTQSSYRSHR